jgi:hypothetical protein
MDTRVASLRQSKDYGVVYTLNDTVRDSFILELNDVEITGRNIHYPNCLFEVTTNYKRKLISPYDERIMSLNRDSFYDNDTWDTYFSYKRSNTYTDPVFFFIYNVDNYYHFIYDTLPILVSYFELKKTIPSLKLLINTSHPNKISFPPFVTEFLASLNINDFVLVSKSTQYRKLYVSTSLTHGQKSSEPSSILARNIWNGFIIDDNIKTPKRFYISRRSWVHGNTENIGTNYTTRRKCMNEDHVVNMLKQYGVEEVFTELLSTKEKLSYFKNAELVVGVVGGGMCNLLFSPSTTKSLCINTPHFLTINKRFEHSMNHTNILYSDSTSHYEKNVKFQLYTRVKVINTSNDYCGLVGEVESRNGIIYSVRLSSNDIAGFSQDFPLELKEFYENELVAIDSGLNSPYICDLDRLENDLKVLLIK